MVFVIYKFSQTGSMERCKHKFSQMGKKAMKNLPDWAENSCPGSARCGADWCQNHARPARGEDHGQNIKAESQSESKVKNFLKSKCRRFIL